MMMAHDAIIEGWDIVSSVYYSGEIMLGMRRTLKLDFAFKANVSHDLDMILDHYWRQQLVVIRQIMKTMLHVCDASYNISSRK